MRRAVKRASNCFRIAGRLSRDSRSTAATADAGFTLPRSVLDEVIAKQTSFPEAVASGKIKFTGNAMRLAELMALMDDFPRMFEIVEPRRTAVS